MALYKHILAGTTQGDDWSFGIHTLSTLDVNAASAAWATAVGQLWTGGIDAYMSDLVIATRATTVSLDQPTGRQINRVDADINLPGASTGGLPYQNSIVVSLKTVVATRQGRGRFYLPPYTLASVSAARLSATAQAGTVTAVNKLFTSLLGAGATPVLYGKTSHLALQIVGGSVGDVFDTQRRRRNKLIENRVALAALG